MIFVLLRSNNFILCLVYFFVLFYRLLIIYVKFDEVVRLGNMVINEFNGMR